MTPGRENILFPNDSFAILADIIVRLLGPGATTQMIARCQISVIGQCFHYAMARPILIRLAGAMVADESAIDELTDHITRFSLAGIASVRKYLTEQAAEPRPSGPSNGETP